MTGNDNRDINNRMNIGYLGQMYLGKCSKTWYRFLLINAMGKERSIRGMIKALVASCEKPMKFVL